MAGDAERARPCRIGILKPAFFAYAGIGVQRVVVAREPIDERRLRQCRQIAGEIRRALGHARAARFAGPGGPPKPPSARQNVVDVSVHTTSPLALSRTVRSRQDQRAFVLALVEDARDLGQADDGAFDRQRPMDREALLAVHDVAARDAGVAVRVPRPGVSEDDRHRRQRDEVLLRRRT